jgi:hypothetical protein
VFLNGTDELDLVKSNREDDLFEATSLRKLPENFLGDVISELPVWAKTVD